MNNDKKKLPLGLRIIRIISILSIPVCLITIWSSYSFIKTNSVTFIGIIDTIYLFFSLFASIFIIYSIKYPRSVFYKTLITILLVDLLLGIPSLTTLNLDSVLLSIFSISFTVVAIWYLKNIKQYFVNGNVNIDDPVVKKVDKRFKLFFIIWIILIFVLPIIMIILSVLDGFNYARRSVEYVKSFKGKDVEQSVKYCQSLGSDTDECLIFLLGQEVATKKDINADFCALFTTETGKLSCYSVLQRCDLVTGGDKMKQACEITSLQFQQETNNIKK